MTPDERARLQAVATIAAGLVGSPGWWRTVVARQTDPGAVPDELRTYLHDDSIALLNDLEATIS